MKVLAQAVNSKRTKLLINLFFKMKTKYILGALCLPAVFTACTNEEFLTENENQLAGKEAVNMVLAANYGAEDQADTRMVNNNGTFLWDNTDVLGATYLINSTSENKIYSNNKFVNTLTEASAQADFTTDATTVVGEYLFYYPYSTKMTNDLSGVQYSLAEPQEYDPTGEKMMKNNFMIAPKITVDGNEPGELTLPITMRSIYGYGTLNLKLAQTLTSNYVPVSELYVQKVIVKYSSNVEKNGVINVATVPAVDLSAENLKELSEDEDGDYYGMTDKEITTALLTAADYNLTARNAENDTYANGSILDLTAAKASNPSNKISQVSISCLSDENPQGIRVTKDGGFSTRVLLPTTAQGGATVDITVYTNKGKFEAAQQTGARIKPNHTINLANINREINKESVMTITSLVDNNAIVAISEEDFIASMQGVGSAVSVEVGDFDLTAAAVAAIPSTTRVTFNSDVKFNGDMTLKNIAFTKGVILKAGNITIDKTVAFSNNQKVSVEGANVTMDNTGAGSLETVVNSGSLTLVDGVNINSYIDVLGGTVNLGANAQTKATPKGISAHLRKVDGGIVNINVPYTSNWNVSVGATKASTLNVNADVTLASSKTITIEAKGIVNNNAELTVATNAGTINNDGTLTVTTNNGTINQMNKNAVIANCTTNNSKIVTVAYSQTTVGTNDGEIVYVDNARIKTTSGNGNVTYVTDAANDANFGSLSSAITKVIFTGNFTYSSSKTLPTAVKALEFQGNLTLSKDWSMSNVTAIAFTGATANITGDNKKITGSFTLTVGVDADQAAGIAAVATDLYIGPNVTITKLTADPDLNGGARVWNDGTVKGSGTYSGNGWSGNAIVQG